MKRHSAHRRTERGLTLVEVLLVVFIIGLASGIVVMTLPQRPSEAETVAREFAATLREAQDRAILSGQPVGVQANDNAYALLQWRREQWQPVSAPASLPRGMALRQLEATDTRANTPEDDTPWPQTIFDPSGVIEPAGFELQSRTGAYTVTIDADGEVRLVVR